MRNKRKSVGTDKEDDDWMNHPLAQHRTSPPTSPRMPLLATLLS
jgi:hypothetical protein